MIDYKIIDSWINWINLLIFWCIHWNETCWFFAISEILKMFEKWDLKLLKWKITFVPISNPKAFQLKKRYIDVNLNRVFKFHLNPKNYEELLANELIKFLDKNDILIDIHSSHSDDKPFVFLDYNDEKNTFLAKSCWVKDILVWWPEIYKNTSYSDTCLYAHNLWKVWITLECWNHFDEKSNKVWINAILRVLNSYWMIDYKIEKVLDFNEIKVKEFIKKEFEWKLTKDFNHMDFVKKWEIIAEYIDGEIILAPYDCFILLPFKDASIWDEWFYLWWMI